MTYCGRCNEEIEAGFFCATCRAELGALHLGNASPYQTLSAPPRSVRVRPDHIPRVAPLADQHGWQELILLDRGLSIDIRANDALLLRKCLSCPIPEPGEARQGTVLHFAIQMCNRNGGRRYTVITEQRPLPAVKTRAEALIQLVSQVRRRLASKYRDS